MTGRAILRLSPIALLVVVAACGGGGTSTVTVTQTVTAPTTTPAAKTRAIRVYYFRKSGIQPVLREVPATPAVGGAALRALAAGPTPTEQHDLGLSTAIPKGGKAEISSIAGGLATVRLTGRWPLTAFIQVLFTLTQFPDVKSVTYTGAKDRRFSRSTFENVQPLILVESPLPFAHVTSPIHASGTANTFEATFQYELKDAAGKILAKHFVTATSGSGVRGTFDVTIPFTVASETAGTLAVYENSAANGQRIHESEIPLTLEP